MLSPIGSGTKTGAIVLWRNWRISPPQVPGREHLRREGLGLAISAVLILDEAAAIRDS